MTGFGARVCGLPSSVRLVHEHESEPSGAIGWQF